MTVGALLQQAQKTLSAAGITPPWLDGEVLLAHVLQKDRSWLLAHPEYRLTPLQRKRYKTLIHRRAKRIPIAYLIGTKEFYGLQFHVTPAVLIPRPETEELIEFALPHLRNLPRGSLVADIGTGSGCIAITLARLLPHLRFVATDAAATALTVARANARRHGVSRRIRFIRDRTFSALKRRKFSAIVANLPYLSARELRTLEPELWHEPRGALVSGARGDEAIRTLLEKTKKTPKLASAALIALEVNPHHADALRALAATLLPTLRWSVQSERANQSRFLIGTARN